MADRHFAYMDDRIRVFEGRPQRFGTQLDLTPDGPRVHELEDPSQVDAWRKGAGLPVLEAALARAQADPLPLPEEYAAKKAAASLWRQEAGWTG
ncbi:MAG: hypothetical protein IH616_14880 [Gemmatimonadales bacterium]|nr:hypothetical protein [Gemmatimonadales bacterium]